MLMGKVASSLIVVTLLFFSCAKENQIQSEKENTIVRINLSSTIFNSSNGNTGRANDSFSREHSQVIGLTEEFNLVATLKPAENQKTPDIALSKKADLKAATPVRTPLPLGTQYIIAVYNTSGDYITHQNYTYAAGQNPEITVQPGTYQFVAVASGNNTLPTINFNQSLANINLEIQDPDIDLMYFSQQLTVLQGQINQLDVVLKHLFTEITVSLNTEAIGEIGAIGQANISPNYSAVNVSLSNGSLSYPSTATSAAKTIVFGATTGEIVISTPIFLFPNNTNSGTISIENLQIGEISKPLTLTNLTIMDGIKYNLEFVLQAAGINIGNEIWSGGNLIYDPADNRYGFTASDNDFGNYWFPGYTLPKLLDGTNQGPDPTINGSAGDPCALVAPAGTWRLPTEAEASQLIDRTGPNGADNPHNMNAYDPARYVDTFDGSGSGTNLGMFFGIQGNPGASRHDYLFCVYAGAYHNENTPGPTIGSEGNYILSGTSGGYRELHLTGNAGDAGYGINIGQADMNTAYQIRCVKQ
ncbi:hypothetical protein C5749_06235 [Sphingobacterium gobiense]|uniref:Fibrobacter succinogenes major paralogous domain-containing protein n=2 Tax=Sphingobacterium gobiense TaxID=1382456 RepID=A0A2S9JU80_9SPHI|nr:hypothetical protein C5749_06235 [Sphingobacterium gobiense]